MSSITGILTVNPVAVGLLTVLPFSKVYTPSVVATITLLPSDFTPRTKVSTGLLPLNSIGVLTPLLGLAIYFINPLLSFSTILAVQAFSNSCSVTGEPCSCNPFIVLLIHSL